MTTVGGDNALIRVAWGPVNGFQTLVKLVRTTELPLAEDGPKEGDTHGN